MVIREQHPCTEWMETGERGISSEPTSFYAKLLVNIDI